MELGHLADNPARCVGFRWEERGSDRILGEDEQERFLAALWAPTMRDMTEFNLWVGLRLGELCGIRGRYVDLNDARLVLPRSRKLSAPR